MDLLASLQNDGLKKLVYWEQLKTIKEAEAREKFFKTAQVREFLRQKIIGN